MHPTKKPKHETFPGWGRIENRDRSLKRHPRTLLKAGKQGYPGTCCLQDVRKYLRRKSWELTCLTPVGKCVSSGAGREKATKKGGKGSSRTSKQAQLRLRKAILEESRTEGGESWSAMWLRQHAPKKQEGPHTKKESLSFLCFSAIFPTAPCLVKSYTIPGHKKQCSESSRIQGGRADDERWDL